MYYVLKCDVKCYLLSFLLSYLHRYVSCVLTDVATVVGYFVVSRPFLNLANPRHIRSSHSELLEVETGFTLFYNNTIQRISLNMLFCLHDEVIL